MTNAITSFSHRLYNTTTASNIMMVGAVLESRGFQWKPVKMEKVQFNSHTISFEEEWNKFIDRIYAITKTNSKNTSMNARPWEHFEHVLSRGYDSEHTFSDTLFQALRTSLNDFVVPTVSKENWIALRNSPIGFGKGISRATLGFPRVYALSRKSKMDHGCFVMGTSVATPSPYQSDGSSSIVRNEEVSWYSDLTAVIEIKLDKTSCTTFAVSNQKFIKEPDLKERDHGPIGQAILYTLDVLHCLARRGQGVKNLPVVLLAGKSNEHIDMGRVCCLEAHINVPEYCGDAFTYSVDQIVTFNGTTGLDEKEACSKEIAAALKGSRDERAIATYIRTLRKGLEHADEVVTNRNTSLIASPVSLCCQSLLPGRNNTELLASPIPREVHLWQSGLRISQGELFKVAFPTKEIFSRLKDLLWFVDTLPKHCLVKVSCASVHNKAINHLCCDKALTKLHGACIYNKKLKQEISKVLLGFCFEGKSESFITVMRDLQGGTENFRILDHQKIQMEGKLPQLWSAFSVLVMSLLLPLADIDVIHLDIRSNKTHTYNILVDENPTDGGDSDNAFVLHLIDYDSLAVTDTTKGTKQDHAVSWKDLEDLGASGESWTSAHRYLLWQVLWIAYTWHPTPPSVPIETLEKETNANMFLFSLFDKKHYLDFKNWLGMETVKSLQLSLMAETITAATIKETLTILHNSFCDQPIA